MPPCVAHRLLCSVRVFLQGTLDGIYGMAGRSKGSVGVVGLGIMGGAFARNLVKSGWRVVGYDLDVKRNRALAKVGVEIAPNVASLAGAVPAIITSLPSPKALDAVVAEIVGAKLAPKVIVEASTFTLDDKMRASLAPTISATTASRAFGLGSRMKYVANLLVAIHNVASAEAMVLGMKAGL